MSASEHSCIYEGYVRHRRFAPTGNAFRYRMFMLYLDLAELPEVFAPYLLWSARRPAPACFRRADFHGPGDVPLDTAVRDTVEARLGCRPAGPIRFLTHLRYWGYIFNPVNFYYCFAPDGSTLEAILAEITNTPWHETHDYVLDCRPWRDEPDAFMNWRFPKEFHVSPFMPMDIEYEWRFRRPGPRLGVYMADHREGQKIFDATLSLQRRMLTGGNLARCLAAYPLMTVKVITAIHWQALRLWLKRIPFHTHPEKRADTN